MRVTRNVRNDGTFPGMDVGKLLVRRGSVGYVRDVGTFLQDQLIYSVHFVDDNRMVGCREEELQLEADPWNPSRFEFRDKVTPRVPLGIRGEVVARPGKQHPGCGGPSKEKRDESAAGAFRSGCSERLGGISGGLSGGGRSV